MHVYSEDYLHIYNSSVSVPVCECVPFRENFPILLIDHCVSFLFSCLAISDSSFFVFAPTIFHMLCLTDTAIGRSPLIGVFR